MFTARNQLLVPQLAEEGGGGQVAFDSNSASVNAVVSAAGTPITWSHTLIAESTVYLDLCVDRAITISAVTCGGVTMSLMDTITYPNIGGLVPFHVRYKLAGVGAGTKTLSITPSGASWVAYGSVAFTGVGSEGTVQHAEGTGTSGSQTPTFDADAGQMILQGFSGSFNGANAMAGSPTPGGGSSRYKSTNCLYNNLGVSDSAVEATQFTWAQGAMAYWRGMAHALIPA